jgi:hypothetical protein
MAAVRSTASTGGFGAVTITKSITIDCGAGQVGSILAAGTNGINVSAAATDIVRIRNLSIQGITTANTGILGTTGPLYVESVVITGFNAGNAAAIRFQPTNASAELFVTDSIMNHNGISTTTGAGIVVVPGATGSANVQITNTKRWMIRLG